MEKRKVETSDAPSALGPYSQGIRATGPQYVFVSGQIGIESSSGEFVTDTVEGQTKQALKNVLSIVKASGGGSHSIVKTTVYLKRIEDFGSMNQAYSDFFDPPYPARSCLGGCALPKGSLIEIEAIALVGR